MFEEEKGLEKLTSQLTDYLKENQGNTCFAGQLTDIGGSQN